MLEQRIIKNVRFLLAVLLIGGASALFNGCYYDNAEDLYPKDTVIIEDTVVIEDTNTVNQWSVDVEPLITANCANSACHGAGNSNGRIPLSTHGEMATGIEQYNLRDRVASGEMPPGGGLPQDELETVLDWIDNGYKNN